MLPKTDDRSDVYYDNRCRRNPFVSFLSHKIRFIITKITNSSRNKFGFRLERVWFTQRAAESRTEQVGAGLCSARQKAPNHQKSQANPYAPAHFGVGADDSVRPQNTAFLRKSTANSQHFRANRVVGPYRRLCKIATAHRAEQSPAPTNCGRFSLVLQSRGAVTPPDRRSCRLQ